MKKAQPIPENKTKISPRNIPFVNSKKFKLVVIRKTPIILSRIPNNFLFSNRSFRTNQLIIATQTAVKLTSNEDIDAAVKVIPTYCNK